MRKLTLFFAVLMLVLLLSGCGIMLVEDMPPTEILAPAPSPEAEG